MQCEFWYNTPGCLTGPGAREAAGRPARCGPINAVSTLALMDFDWVSVDNPHGTRRMRLVATHPGVTAEEVIAQTGFDLIVPERVGVTDPPSAEELRILRQEIDPERLYI